MYRGSLCHQRTVKYFKVFINQLLINSNENNPNMMFICLNSPELSGRRVNSFILIDTDREDLTFEFAQSSI